MAVSKITVQFNHNNPQVPFELSIDSTPASGPMTNDDILQIMRGVTALSNYAASIGVQIGTDASWVKKKIVEEIAAGGFSMVAHEQALNPDGSVAFTKTQTMNMESILAEMLGGALSKNMESSKPPVQFDPKWNSSLSSP